MSSTTTCWDKIDQRRDPVILCQSLADVQWPLVTIKALCASMSECTCLLLTLNPHRELAGNSWLLMSMCVYSIFFLGRGERCPSVWHVRTDERPSRIGINAQWNKTQYVIVYCCILKTISCPQWHMSKQIRVLNHTEWIPDLFDPSCLKIVTAFKNVQKAIVG